MVGVPSTALPSMKRVEPGDPDRSWFMRKLDGTQSSFEAQLVGGFCGSSMPPGEVPLTEAERAVVRAIG